MQFFYSNILFLQMIISRIQSLQIYSSKEDSIPIQNVWSHSPKTSHWTQLTIRVFDLSFLIMEGLASHSSTWSSLLESAKSPAFNCWLTLNLCFLALFLVFMKGCLRFSSLFEWPSVLLCLFNDVKLVNRRSHPSHSQEYSTFPFPALAV